MKNDAGNDRRAAFTMLEVIIASGLATVLMALVWSLFSIYSKLNDRGAVRSVELQLVRSIVRQLRSDIRAASAFPNHAARPSEFRGRGAPPAPVPPPSPASTPPMSATGPGVFGDSGVLGDLTEEGDRTADLPRAQVPASGQWVGDSQQLRLLTRAPVPGIYDVVEYVWHSPPDDERLDAMVDGAFSGLDAPLEEGLEETGDVFPRDSVGLTRRATGLFRERPTEDRSNDNASRPDPFDRDPFDREPSAAIRGREGIGDGPGTGPSVDSNAVREDVAPEIRRLRFRYFDGTAWHAVWDSGPSGRLPVAIEIAFDVDVAATVRASSEVLDDAVQEDAYEYRFVITVDTPSARRAAAGEVVP